MAGIDDIDALHRRFSPLVLRRVRRFYAPEDRPEEVVQDVFAALAKEGAQLDDGLRPSSALYRKTTQFCLARLQKAAGRRSLMVTPKGVGGWVEAVGGVDEPSVKRLRSTWRSLSPDLLEVAVYVELDGMTAGQIAELTTMPRERVLELMAELRKSAGPG